MTQANFMGSRFESAGMMGVRAAEASFQTADLSRVDLTGAFLANADLSWANCAHSVLDGANLRGANLSRANIGGVSLQSADITEAVMYETVLWETDFSRTVGIDNVIHNGPSDVGIWSILNSLRKADADKIPEMRGFFVSAGVPAWVMDGVSGVSLPLEYKSCFICYGEPDKWFARSLSE